MKAQTITVRQLRNCVFSGKNKGFAISLDAFFAIILLIALTAYVGIGSQPIEQSTIKTSTQTNAKQLLDDALIAIDNNGLLGQVLVDETGAITNIQAQEVYDRLQAILPSNMDAKVTITQYEPVDAADMPDCRAEKTFGDCFKPNPTIITAGSTIPTGKDTFYGNQLFMKKQPYLRGQQPNACILESELKEKPTQNIKALMQGASTITTKVELKNSIGNNFTGNRMQCYETGASNDEIAKITLLEKSTERDPVAVMAVIDKSGSMSKLDMVLKNKSGNFDSGNCSPIPPGTCSTGIPASNNCNSFSGWITNVGSFELTQATKDLLTSSPTTDNLAFWNRYTTIQSGIGNYACSNAKIRVKNPAGTYWYYANSTNGNNATTYAYVNDSVPANLGVGSWSIDLWADKSTRIDRPIWVGLYFGLKNIAILNPSPHVSSQITCTTPNDSIWTKIGEFTISDARLYWTRARVYHNYNYSEGICGVVARIKKPDGTYSAITSSKSSPLYPYVGNLDNPLAASAPFDAVLLPTGTYEIEAWSDRPVTITSLQFEYELFLSKISPITIAPNTYPPNAFPTGYYNSGLCGSPAVTCVATPATGNTCSTPRTWAFLDSFNVSRNLRGLRVDITAQSYTGACSYPRFGLKSPTFVDTNATGGKPTTNTCITINRNTTYDTNSQYGSTSCGSGTVASPLTNGDWNMFGWSDVSIPYSLAWRQQRIDAAIEAAGTFVNNASWQSTDKMGLVSYSDNSNLVSGLVSLDAAGKATLITNLNTLPNFNPIGETNSGDSIETAKNTLSSVSYKKFIVLLSDGQANKPDPTATAVGYAINKANDARTVGITIYTIGFGRDVNADSLKDIARDPCDSYAVNGKCVAGSVRLSGGVTRFADCFVNNDPSTLTIDPAKYCGRYYFAGDPQTLQQIYEMIAIQIGSEIQNSQTKVNSIPGMELCRCTSDCTGECTPASLGCTADAVDCWTTTQIVFPTRSIPADPYLSQSFKARLPCNGEYCNRQTAEFPPIGAYPEGTSITNTSTNEVFEWGNETICDSDNCTGWYDAAKCSLLHCTKTIDFDSKDLGITFTGGTMNGMQSTLNFEVKNNGSSSIAGAPLEIGFFKDTISTANWLQTSSPTCSGGSCVIAGAPDKNIHWTGTINGEQKISFSNTVNNIGYINAIISNANECSQNNIAKIYCLQESKTFYYKVEYWAWNK